jgi:hypothetical protein
VTAPDDRAEPDTVHSRRAVLEGAAVAIVAAVGGFAWFSAVGPPSEEERDAEEDERDDGGDDSGPGGGDQS